jgi:dihydropteroate synthase
MTEHKYEWHLADQSLALASRPLVMGIVNVTPDSFSDGGYYASTEEAVAHGTRLAEQGADILDIGGESSRPGAQPVTADEELRRVLPVVRELAVRVTAPLSVDTTKATVAEACLAAGAKIINDITALRGDPAMAAVARAAGAGVILMHMQGTPATMQNAPHYDDVMSEIALFFETRLQALEQMGIGSQRVVLDPGIGFGKTAVHNLEILARCGELQRLGRPVCLGVSRKGFLGKMLDRPVQQRLAASLAALCYAMGRGAAQLLRVHDVAQTCDAVKVFEAIRNHGRK